MVPYWSLLDWVLNSLCVCVQEMKGTDGYSDSDEDEHDAYLERMKEEGKIREEGDDSEGDSGE